MRPIASEQFRADFFSAEPAGRIPSRPASFFFRPNHFPALFKAAARGRNDSNRAGCISTPSAVFWTDFPHSFGFGAFGGRPGVFRTRLEARQTRDSDSRAEGWISGRCDQEKLWSYLRDDKGTGSNVLCMQANAECASYLQHRGKARVAVLAERFIQVLAAEPGIARNFESCRVRARSLAWRGAPTDFWPARSRSGCHSTAWTDPTGKQHDKDTATLGVVHADRRENKAAGRNVAFIWREK